MTSFLNCIPQLWFQCSYRNYLHTPIYIYKVFFLNVASPVGLTEEEVVAQSFILMIAGFETTSSTISFFLYNMMANQKCQEKLQREIDEVVGDSVSAILNRRKSLRLETKCY